MARKNPPLRVLTAFYAACLPFDILVVCWQLFARFCAGPLHSHNFQRFFTRTPSHAALSPLPASFFPILTEISLYPFPFLLFVEACSCSSPERFEVIVSGVGELRVSWSSQCLMSVFKHNFLPFLTLSFFRCLFSFFSFVFNTFEFVRKANLVLRNTPGKWLASDLFRSSVVRRVLPVFSPFSLFL